MEKLIPIEEAAELTGLSIHTIYKYVCSKKIPHVKLGNRLLFSPERLKQWIDEHSVEPISSGSSM